VEAEAEEAALAARLKVQTGNFTRDPEEQAATDPSEETAHLAGRWPCIRRHKGGKTMPTIDLNDVYVLDNTGRQVDESVDYANANGNRNLLHNPFFTINQQGQTSYTGNVYMVDRWRGANSRTTITVNAGYVNLSTNASGNGLFRQILENDYTGVLTYSAYVRGTGSGLLSVLDSGGTVLDEFTFDNPGNDWTLISKTYEATTPVNSVRFRVDTSTNYDIKCAKLELGSYCTLMNDVAPDYGPELLKCQPYYHLYGTSAARPSNRFDCVPHMVSNPTQGTITIGGTTYYYNNANL